METGGPTAVDAIADRFTEHLRQGEFPEIESYLPSDSSREAVLSELVYEQCYYELKQASPASVAALKRRYPGDGKLIEEAYARACRDIERVTRIGDYEIVEKIAEGGYGLVWRALGPNNVTVALKVFKFTMQDDIRKEVQLVQQLNHPAIVRIQHTFTDPVAGGLVLVMDYIDGRSLRDKLKDKVKYDPGPAAELMQQLAGAVAHAHEKGILHRDLKPENILIDASDKPHIIDFNLAIHVLDVGEALQAGSKPYVAPEGLRGMKNLDYKYDVYSLGVIFYELLTGQRPSACAPDTQFAFPSNIPDVLADMCKNCLSSNITARWSALELRDHLDKYLKTLRSGVHPPSAPSNTHAPARSGWPRMLTEFVGREEQVRELLEAVLRRPLVTILAFGGVGKTRLALKTAEEEAASRHFTDGIDFVPMEDLHQDSEKDVFQALITALHLPPFAPGSELTALVEAFQRYHKLLIFDNCETAPQAIANVAAALLGRCPHLHILATSQRPLNVDGEHQIALQPMWVPTENTCSLADLEKLECFKLFCSRAKIQCKVQDVPALLEILRVTDGIPLALEIVAALARRKPLKEIATGLQASPLREMAAVPQLAGRAERHRSVERCFDYTFGLLDADAQLCFARLSIFADTFSVSSVAAVFRLSNASDLLARLHADAALIQPVPDTDPQLYSMLPLLRAYALQKSTKDALADSVRREFVDHFKTFLWVDRNDAQYREGLRANWRNILRAAEIATSQHRGGIVCAISQHLSRILVDENQWFECDRLCHMALQAVVGERDPQKRKQIESLVQLNLGHLYERWGRRQDAITAYSISLRYCEEAKQYKNQAPILDKLAHLYQQQGRESDALAMSERSVAIRRQFPDAEMLPIALDKKGEVLARQGRFADAEKAFLEGLEHRRKAGNRFGEANSHLNLGRLYRRDHRPAEAERELKTACKMLEDLSGSHERLIVALHSLAEFYISTNCLNEAEPIVNRNLEMRKQYGDLPAQALGYQLLGRWHFKRRELAKAESALCESVRLSERIHELAFVGATLDTLADLYIQKRQWPEAEKVLTKSLQSKEQDPLGHAVTLEKLANTYKEMERWGEAEERFRQSLELSEKSDAPMVAGITLFNLGSFYACRGRLRESVEALRRAKDRIQGTTDDQTKDLVANLLSTVENCIATGTPYQAKTDGISGLSIAIRNWGAGRRNSGKLDEMIESYRALLQSAREANDSAKVGRVLNELGSAYRKGERWNESEAVLEEALGIFRAAQDLEGESASLHKLGSLHAAQRMYEKAETFYSESLKVRAKYHSGVGAAFTYDDLGVMYTQMERWSEAEASLLDAIRMFREHFRYRKSLGEALLHLGLLHEAHGNRPDSLKAAIESEGILITTGDTRFLPSVRALIDRLRAMT